MIRRLGPVLAVAVLAVSLAPPLALAGHPTSRSHPHIRDFGPHPQSYDGTLSAEWYSNCLPWSPQLRNWVWVCGPPYPPEYPHTR
jgi:hypothetical protein